MKLRWKYTERTENCTALSYTDEGPDHYVVSHRSRQHTISHRPPGEHHHVSTWTSKAGALRAAQEHADERHARQRTLDERADRLAESLSAKRAQLVRALAIAGARGLPWSDDPSRFEVFRDELAIVSREWLRDDQGYHAVLNDLGRAVAASLAPLLAQEREANARPRGRKHGLEIGITGRACVELPSSATDDDRAALKAAIEGAEVHADLDGFAVVLTLEVDPHAPE